MPYILGNACWNADLTQPVQTTDSSTTLQTLGISGQRPEEPNLAILDRRRATYLTYPHSTVSVDVETLCKAGYYYAGQFFDKMLPIFCVYVM